MILINLLPHREAARKRRKEAFQVTMFLAVVVGLLAGVGVFMLTAKGAETREFLSESRFELRKVVWPTRQEAMRMTWVVVIVVIIIALLLAGFDTVIQWLVKLFLGQ